MITSTSPLVRTILSWGKLDAPHRSASAACLALQHLNPFVLDELGIGFPALATEYELLGVPLYTIVHDRLHKPALENGLIALQVARCAELPVQVFHEVFGLTIQGAGDAPEISQCCAISNYYDISFGNLKTGLLENGLGDLLERAVQQFLIFCHFFTSGA